MDKALSLDIFEPPPFFFASHFLNTFPTRYAHWLSNSLDLGALGVLTSDIVFLSLCSLSCS
jgi:hypothetical protein